MSKNIFFTLVAFVLLTPTWAAERLTPTLNATRPINLQTMERSNESVLLIEMRYSNGKWQAKPMSILPCGGPSKADSISPTRSMFQLTSREGKTLYRRYIENPRIILVEDPKEEAALLKETAFTLRIPLRSQGRSMVTEKDVYNFEFYEQERENKKPVARVNLSKMMPRLSKMRTTKKRPSCQLIEPRMDKLPELKPGPETGISTDSLASMIKKDKGMLVSWGIENSLAPDELKKLVMTHKDQWTRLQLNQRSVDALLDEYNKAYRAR